MATIKSAGELLEMPEGEPLDYVESVRSPEARAALLAELIEMKRVDQMFLSAGFSPRWLALLHSVALGLESETKSFGLPPEMVDDLRAIVHHVMGIKTEDEL